MKSHTYACNRRTIHSFATMYIAKIHSNDSNGQKVLGNIVKWSTPSGGDVDVTEVKPHGVEEPIPAGWVQVVKFVSVVKGVFRNFRHYDQDGNAIAEIVHWHTN